jgi:hypothetical protein
LFNRATQEKKDSESFAHEIVPVRYLELKRKTNFDHIESLMGVSSKNAAHNSTTNNQLVNSILKREHEDTIEKLRQE